MQTVIRALALSFLLFWTLNNCAAQRKPLIPNGKPQNLSMALQPFENLELLWLDGKIEVEFGADTSTLEIISDENILQLIRVENAAGTLKIDVADNEQNRLWLEDDKTTVKIRTTSQPHAIIYKCNANASLRGIAAEKLNLEKDMNGDLKMSGKVDVLTLRKDDNGSIYASELAVGQADVSIKGNGDVQLSAQQFLRREASGNGGIGNANDAPTPVPLPVRRVRVTFYNNRAGRGDFYVTGTNEAGKTFSYGLELGAFAKESESLPVGTQVYQGSGKSGKLLVTLEEADDKQTVKLFE